MVICNKYDDYVHEQNYKYSGSHSRSFVYHHHTFDGGRIWVAMKRKREEQGKKIAIFTKIAPSFQTRFEFLRHREELRRFFSSTTINEAHHELIARQQQRKPTCN